MCSTQSMEGLTLKLFRYLIIDDTVKYKFLTPLNVYEEPEYYVNNKKNNKIYYYNEVPEIAFMSFRYQNSKMDIFENANSHKWAYAIIDNDNSILRVIRNHKNWSTDKDKKEKIENATGRIRVEDTPDGRKYSIIPYYLRFGGHLGAGSDGKRVCTLQELILETKQVIKVKHAELPHRLDKDGNKVKQRAFVYGWPERMAERIHHKGYTFDNRIRYLEPLSKKAHDAVHNTWEEKNGFKRPKKVELGDDFSNTLYCDCDNHDCKNCNAVLHIENEEQFIKFITELMSNDYRKLERKHIYDDVIKGK